MQRYGEAGWHDYWKPSCKANGVKVVDGWTAAYEDTFTAGGGKGDRPLVVSYATSPPADVYYARPEKSPPTWAWSPTGASARWSSPASSHGTKHRAAAEKVVDFLAGADVQADMPLQMYVFPVVRGTPLPDVFTTFAVRSGEPVELPPADVGREARRLGRRLDERRAAGSEPPHHRRADRPRHRRGGAGGVPRRVFSCGRSPHILLGLRPDGHWDLGAAWDVLRDPSTRRVLWFTVWQAVLSTVAHPGRRPARRVRAQPRAVPGAEPGAGARDGAVRPADRRRRRARSGALGVERHGAGDHRRARLLQLRPSSCAPSAACGRTSTPRSRRPHDRSARAGGARSAR